MAWNAQNNHLPCSTPSMSMLYKTEQKVGRQSPHHVRHNTAKEFPLSVMTSTIRGDHYKYYK